MTTVHVMNDPCRTQSQEGYRYHRSKDIRIDVFQWYHMGGTNLVLLRRCVRKQPKQEGCPLFLLLRWKRRSDAADTVFPPPNHGGIHRLGRYWSKHPNNVLPDTFVHHNHKIMKKNGIDSEIWNNESETDDDPLSLVIIGQQMM